MKRFARALAFFRRLWSSRRAERDLHDDVQAYADLLADELQSRGASPESARRQARLALGGVEAVKESVRSARSGAWLEDAWRDVVIALRGFRRSPGFALTAIVTLALGIGVNTTMFSVIDSTLFKPLPYVRPNELVEVGHKVHRGVATTTMMGITWSEVDLWREDHVTFQGVEAWKQGKEQRWRDHDRSVFVGAFSPGMPALLGQQPALGRVFTEDEARQNAAVIVIADALWTETFAKRADVLGSTMTIGDRVFTIIGAMPPTFRFGPAGSGQSDVWTPLYGQGSGGTHAVWRMRTGLSLDAATTLASITAAKIQQSQPDSYKWTPELVPLEGDRANLRSGMQSPMLLLLSAAGLVLLVACVNVANLLLTRGASRRHEIALRTALGASRGRLIRFLLTEGLAIAVLGGLAAVIMAHWTSGAVISLIPPRMRAGMFRVAVPELDWRVLFFAIAATMTVALLSAAWPAFAGSSVALRSALGTGGQVAGDTRERRRVSRILQATQVALAFVLAATAALFATSFAKTLNADLGFDPNGLGVVTFNLPDGRYRTEDAQRVAIDEALVRVRATPGVQSAALGGSPASTMTAAMIREGSTGPAVGLAIRYVGPGYFSAAGIKLIAGRDFGASDVRGAPPVAIIDEALARSAFPGESPLGQRVQYSSRMSPPFTIVGIVGKVAAYDFASTSTRGGMFRPMLQDLPAGVVLVRSQGDLPSTLKSIQASLESLTPGLRVTSSGTALDVLDVLETFATPRFYTVLVTMFAVLALVTASVGLYGLLAHAVNRRRREIGIRVALGSTPAGIRRLVLTEAFVPVAAGLVAGIAAAWWSAGLLGSFLYGIGPRDPRAFALGALALLLAALLASVFPIRRATGMDPLLALKEN